MARKCYGKFLSFWEGGKMEAREMLERMAETAWDKWSLVKQS